MGCLLKSAFQRVFLPVPIQRQLVVAVVWLKSELLYSILTGIEASFAILLKSFLL